MLITGFPAGPLAANCYVLAPGDGAGCVVVDPGQRASDPLRRLLADHGLTPVAALVTHGHFDHVGSVGEVCAEYDIPLYIGAGDEYMLADPWAAVSPELAAGIGQLLGPGERLEPIRPAEVITLGSEYDADLELADLSIAVLPVPGHTQGSVVYRVAPEDGPEVLLTGDTLFAGSIGRTDLPGGSTPGILQSIRRQLLTRADDAVVLPGHGEASTIGRERASNPFLQ